MKDERLQEMIDKVWPRTKKELERAIVQTKKLIVQGEKHFKVISQKSIKNTKKLTLSLKREKLYYSLGKSVAGTPKTKWGATKKINSLIGNIKKLEEQIQQIK